MVDIPFPRTEFATKLLGWYGVSGRDLPWRHTRDPYAIWLSEIMLQQTGVDTVIPYFRRFLERYPDVSELAAASVEEVIELWSGLGYYRRARNLHAAAVSVVREYGGQFPETLEGLQSLPGVGRSTAGAIVSIAFDRPAPILDGNVRRVLCRVFALRGDPRSSAAEKKLWAWAEALTSRERPHDYAQAIMDLGATLCLPRQPDCTACPVHKLCSAHRQGIVNELPESRPRKPLPERRQVALILENSGSALVCRRGLEGMLGGLWEFPGMELGEGGSPSDAAMQIALQRGGQKPRALGNVKHIYSHFRLNVALYHAQARNAKVAEQDSCRWVPVADLQDVALHGAHQKALKLWLDSKEK